MSKLPVLALGLLLAAAVPSPSPSPVSQLRTIATVRATPYCTSLANHFNGAVAPMLANDRTLDNVSVQLDDVNQVFNKPDYQIRYADERAKLVNYVGNLQRNLPYMQQQINGLRLGERLTKDADQAKAIHMLAEKLQLAYNKQYQLSQDLLGVVHAMMDFRPGRDANSYENQLAEQNMPVEMRDVKSYLKFNGQRDVIADAEDKSADMALNIASKYCGVNP